MFLPKIQMGMFRCTVNARNYFCIILKKKLQFLKMDLTHYVSAGIVNCPLGLLELNEVAAECKGRI
jgi:hypothetical protein